MLDKFDGIIFDVDGTLWDSTNVVEDAWNAAIKECGIKGVSVNADQLKGLFGLPMEDIIDRVLPDEDAATKARFKPLCYSNEESYLKEKAGVLYPDLVATIRELKKSYPLFIVSNCQSGYIELFLEKTGLGDCIIDHLCPGDSGKLKADNIRIIADRNNLKNPVYVGDTQMDADACKAAGVPIIFAKYGFGNVESPDETIETFKDLLKVLG